MAAFDPTRPTLMLVTDRRRVGGLDHMRSAIASAVDAGVDIVNVREHDLATAERRSFLRSLADTVGSRAAIVVNGDIPAALDLGLGIHRPERYPPLTAAELAAMQPGALVGRSIHGPYENVGNREDYFLFGHVFPSGSKPGAPPRGLSLLGAVVRSAPRRVLAIGGITAANADAALACGVAGVAVIGAILDAPDVAVATRELRIAIDRAHEIRKATVVIESEVTISVTLNGKPTELPNAQTVSQFLESRALVGKLVVVEINGSIVPRSTFDEHAFASGDLVEIVHFVGGG